MSVAAIRPAGIQTDRGARRPPRPPTAQNLRVAILSDPQPEVSLHRSEIPMIVQQTVPFLNAERSDNHIDRLAHGNPQSAQTPVILGGSNRKPFVHHSRDRISTEALLNPNHKGIVPCPLQDLKHDQIADQDPIVVILGQCPEFGHRDIVDAAKVRDPNRAIDDDHGSGSNARPSRIASKSPSHPRPAMSATAFRRW